MEIQIFTHKILKVFQKTFPSGNIFLSVESGGAILFSQQKVRVGPNSGRSLEGNTN